MCEALWLRSLTSHYLTGIYWITNQRCEVCAIVCVSACWNTVLPGHNVQMDGYQSLCVHVQVLTVTGVVKCLCGLVSHAKSVGVCVVSWTLRRFKLSENLPGLHKKTLQPVY